MKEKRPSSACEICDYNCSQMSHMKSHIVLVHEGSKPFACHICDFNCFSEEPHEYTCWICSWKKEVIKVWNKWRYMLRKGIKKEGNFDHANKLLFLWQTTSWNHHIKQVYKYTWMIVSFCDVFAIFVSEARHIGTMNLIKESAFLNSYNRPYWH